jgi:hypothetical protein
VGVRESTPDRATGTAQDAGLPAGYQAFSAFGDPVIEKARRSVRR